MATRAPARIMSWHRGGMGMSAMRLDMVRSPRRWRETPLSGPHESPGAGQPRTPEAAPRGLAVRHAGGVAPAGRGRNCRCRDRNGGGFVLTVGAGLGYGLSGGSGVPRTRQRRERTGEQVGDRGPCGRPDRSRKVRGRVCGGRRVRGDLGGPGQGRGCADRRLRHLRHQEPPRPHWAQSQDGRKLNIAASTAPTFKAGKPLAGCRHRRRIMIGVTGDRGQAGTGGAAC